MSSSVSVTALNLPQRFPSVCVCVTQERGIFPNHSRGSCLDSLTSLPLAPSDALRIETISFSPRYSGRSGARRNCLWSLMKLGTHRWCSCPRLQSSNLQVLGLASSRTLVRGVALCSLHSEAPTLGLLHVLLPLTPVDSRRQLGLCHPVSHGPDSSWECRRVLHRIPPNELDQHGPSGHGLHSPRCTQPCKCFDIAIINVVVLRMLCSPASISAVSLFVRSETWGRPMCLFRQTRRHHPLAINREFVLVLHSSLYLVKKKPVALSC